MLVLVTDSLASCLHFIRLFWNHTLTWLSDKPSIAASWCLSAFVRYFCTWKRFSSPFRCKLENTARVQGLLGLRDRSCPWIDWVHISDEVDGCLLLQLVKASNRRKNKSFHFEIWHDLLKDLVLCACAGCQKGVVGDFYIECLHFTSYATHGAQKNRNNHTDNTILYMTKE